MPAAWGAPEAQRTFQRNACVDAGARDWREFYGLSRVTSSVHETLKLPFYDTHAIERLARHPWIAESMKEAANRGGLDQSEDCQPCDWVRSVTPLYGLATGAVVISGEAIAVASPNSS